MREKSRKGKRITLRFQGVRWGMGGRKNWREGEKGDMGESTTLRADATPWGCPRARMGFAIQVPGVTVPAKLGGKDARFNLF